MVSPCFTTRKFLRTISVRCFASGIGQGFQGFTLVPDGDKESPPVIEVGVVFMVSTARFLGVRGRADFVDVLSHGPPAVVDLVVSEWDMFSTS